MLLSNIVHHFAMQYNGLCRLFKIEEITKLLNEVYAQILINEQVGFN